MSNMIDIFDTEEGKKEIERIAKEIRDQIDRGVLEQIHEIIKKQREDAFDRAKKVI